MREDQIAYYLNIAIAVREKANCRGTRVGAVVVVGNRIVATGYNGTPAGMPNCMDGGCVRCARRASYPSGVGYDLCICVHAEQNALLSAARFGISVGGGTMFTTVQPCFGCAKEMLQAEIAEIYYMRPWSGSNDAEFIAQYERILAAFPQGVHRFDIPDPQAEWARGEPIPAASGVSDSTSHALPELSPSEQQT